ncbi:unnamed protein product, partial [Amoebophrya sp. A25]
GPSNSRINVISQLHGDYEYDAFFMRVCTGVDHPLSQYMLWPSPIIRIQDDFAHFTTRLANFLLCHDDDTGTDTDR